MNTHKRKLPALIAAAVCAAPLLAQAGDASDRFEKPVELLTNGKSISSLMYPSPTLYDLDGDGKRELVIGEIMGSITAAQKAGNDLTAWGDITPVNNTDGEPLKLANW